MNEKIRIILTLNLPPKEKFASKASFNYGLYLLFVGGEIIRVLVALPASNL